LIALTREALYLVYARDCNLSPFLCFFYFREGLSPEDLKIVVRELVGTSFARVTKCFERVENLITFECVTTNFVPHRAVLSWTTFSRKLSESLTYELDAGFVTSDFGCLLLKTNCFALELIHVGLSENAGGDERRESIISEV
jgi:hypothetical protein